jgi:hypothetical protein
MLELLAGLMMWYHGEVGWWSQAVESRHTVKSLKEVCCMLQLLVGLMLWSSKKVPALGFAEH